MHFAQSFTFNLGGKVALYRFIVGSITFAAKLATAGLWPLVSGVRRPPRTVAPITIPALTSTMFLIMYCPSSVGAYGICAKVSWGKKINGVMVPSICTHSKSRVARMKTPKMSPKPIRHSHVARSKSAVSGAMRPKVSMLMVRVARSCAGLRPAKNLRAPNHMKTIPRLMRNKRMPCAAIQRVRCASIASANDHRLDMRRV